ncbi:MAG: MMPL family transporter [Candidatus Aenigmarchaeota archaeon]|nr:MMPL family transporter [Candidatus Aenigmarchaeota archaeon]
MNLGFFKNWKILIWILFILGSIALISPRFGSEGLQIDYVSPDSPVQLAEGDLVYSINGDVATQQLLEGRYEGIVSLQTSKGTQLVRTNGTLGITGKPPATTNLKFGLDVEGGVRTVLLLNDSDPATVEQSISTIQTRINLFGLREANIRSIREGQRAFIEITMAGGDVEEITKLVESQGRFEATIPILLDIRGNQTTFTLDEKYAVRVEDGILHIGDHQLAIGEQETIDGIPIIFEEFNSLNANLTTIVFTSDDIEFVYFDPQRSGAQPQDEGYSWFFQVRLTEDGANRFAKITQNLDVVFGIGEGGLSSPLELYLDGELVETLRISSELKGEVIREPSVTGFGNTLDEAVTEQRRLQSILRSGALPTDIEIVRSESLSPMLGEAFLRNMMIAIVSAIIAVSIVIAIRYRRIKVVVPIIITAFSEVLIILGMSVLIGWTLDLASMAAIIAILGTGMDAQIIIVDQAIKGKRQEYGMKERLKRALFMIVASGGTVIAAMLPLMGIGLGVLRGFAITTIIGVLIGILITRPAFNEMMKDVV